jgi:hypothetical protein
MFFRRKKKKVEDSLKRIEILNTAFESYMRILESTCEDLQRIQVMDTTAYHDILMVFASLKPGMNNEQMVNVIKKALDVIAANCQEVTREAALSLNQIANGCEEIQRVLEDYERSRAS